MKTVRIAVEGGVIQDIDCPRGVKIIVHDYDVDGISADELTKDDEGDDCIEVGRLYAAG